jgi:nucleoside-diphosphate-sugar epimerase
MQSAARRVLVPGADGFIGSHLVERLLDDGHEVAAVVRGTSVVGTSELRLRNLAPVRGRLAAVLAMDIAGGDATARMAEFAPQWVFHLAAEAWVERSFTQPSEVLRTNLGGTMAVLQLARSSPGIERVVITSSSEIYGTAQAERIDEGHPLNPTSPYAASKLAADRMAFAYVQTYGLPIAIVRPFNCYGPRHTYDVIPKFIARALAGQPLTVFGDGSQARDFTYVDDMVDAFVLAATHPATVGRAINFGSGASITIAALAARIVALSGVDVAIEHGPARAAEVARLCCDASVARAMGWAPRVGLDEGLRRNIAWARTQPSHAPAVGIP